MSTRATPRRTPRGCRCPPAPLIPPPVPAASTFADSARRLAGRRRCLFLLILPTYAHAGTSCTLLTLPTYARGPLFASASSQGAPHAGTRALVLLETWPPSQAHSLISLGQGEGEGLGGRMSAGVQGGGPGRGQGPRPGIESVPKAGQTVVRLTPIDGGRGHRGLSGAPAKQSNKSPPSGPQGGRVPSSAASGEGIRAEGGSGRPPVVASLVDTGSELGTCSICRKSCALLKSGLIHQHGPRTKPCLGSGKRPLAGSRRPAPKPSAEVQHVPSTLAPDNDSPNDSSSQDLFVSFHTPPPQASSIGHPVRRAPILRRIPKGARPEASRVLGGLLREIVKDVEDIDDHGPGYSLSAQFA